MGDNELEDDEIQDFQFYTEEELLILAKDMGLAQKRINKIMQISRLTHAIKAILLKMGYGNEKGIERSELRGDIIDSSLYDAYLIAKYERAAARKKLNEMPTVPKIANILHLFFFEVQKADPVFWKEMRERAASRAAKISTLYQNITEEESPI